MTTDNPAYQDFDPWRDHPINCGCERCIPSDTLIRWELRIWNRMHNCPASEHAEVKAEWRRLIREVKHRGLIDRVIWK